MEVECNSTERQNRTRKYQQSLHLSSVIQEKNCSFSESKKFLRERSIKSEVRGRQSGRTDADLMACM